MQWSDLREECEWYVAREIARSRVTLEARRDRILVDVDQWAHETKLALPEACLKINEMSNLQVIELIGKVIARHA